MENISWPINTKNQKSQYSYTSVSNGLIEANF